MQKLIIAAAFALIACATSSSIDPLAMDEATFQHELEARFQYGPPQPEPLEAQDQRTGQIADAAYLTAFPEYGRAYSQRTRVQAQQLAERLRLDAGELTHEQFVLRVAEIAALADNGHTTIGENAFKKNTPRLPLRTYLFADGLYVLRATQANADLLGARIDAIDGRSLDQVYNVIARYQGGTDAHRRVQLIPMLESPALLHAAGIAHERGALTLRGVLANGAVFEQRVAAEQRDRSAPVSNTARTTYPTAPEATMASYLKDGAALPTYLHSRNDLFWIEATEAGGLYVGLAHNADADEAPIASFLDHVLERVRSERPAFVALDMRMNGGGDYTTTYAFARALPEAARGASIYVLTSAWTFSAAITTVAALEEAGRQQVIIVGEDVGDRLDFWAEGGSFNLPNTFVQVHYASARHNYTGPCSDRETCFWLNDRYPVRVSSLAPDIAAPLTFAAYREGRDLAMEAVLAREVRRD